MMVITSSPWVLLGPFSVLWQVMKDPGCRSQQGHRKHGYDEDTLLKREASSESDCGIKVINESLSVEN